MHEGVWITNPIQIKEAFLNFFKEKFKANDSLITFPHTRTSSTLQPSDRDYLESNTTMDEVKTAAWECGSDKAPGPDGYTFTFMKSLGILEMKTLPTSPHAMSLIERDTNDELISILYQVHTLRQMVFTLEKLKRQSLIVSSSKSQSGHALKAINQGQRVKELGKLVWISQKIHKEISHKTRAASTDTRIKESQKKPIGSKAEARCVKLS
ncbi:hypothetical protein Tco_0214680 [Tanacetum coccineum]